MRKKDQTNQHCSEQAPENPPACDIPADTACADATQHAAPEPTGAEELLNLLNAAEAQRDEYLGLAQRLQADFDNFRRRNQNTYRDAYQQGVCETVTKFLPVLDNIERALGADGQEESLRAGVELIKKQFIQVLSGMGIEEISAQDCAFDPNIHNAVLQEVCDAQSGTVTGVLQKGYCMEGKVLRYSMVKVAQ
ncbi:MAG: nucleotide exchange factor GrpE [Eubacteriales bacterium]|nr:nucleotide exchange factor GrpE [Eubacteriales bacterium]